MLFLTIAEYFIRRPLPQSLFGARLAGVTAGMLLITGLFYLYTFLIGRSFLIADILLFLLGVCFTYVLSGHLLRSCRRADLL